MSWRAGAMVGRRTQMTARQGSTITSIAAGAMASVRLQGVNMMVGLGKEGKVTDRRDLWF